MANSFTMTDASGSPATALADTIAANAAQPKRVTADGVSAEQHSIPDQIAADKYASAKAAARKGVGLKFVKIVPGGPTD